MKGDFDRFFGLHFDLHPTANDTILGADVSEQNIEELIIQVKPDFVNYDCKGHEGFTGFDTKVGTPSPGIVKDALEVWRKVTKKHGVKLGVHYSGVVDTQAIVEHPEWGAINADGRNGYWSTSVFGDYVDKLLIPQLKEVVAKYDIDSLWLDGEAWGAQLDYSDKAIAKWCDQTGFKSVPRSDKDDNWEEWKDFHRKEFENYLCHWVDAMHHFKKELCVISNWAYTAMMAKEVVADIDVISGDYDPKNSVDRARVEVRYLANVGLPWELMAWGFDNAKDNSLGKAECLKTAVHLKQEAAVVLMYGGGFVLYYIPTRSGYINDGIINTSAEVAAFCRERQNICQNLKSIPQVAILCSESYWRKCEDRPFNWGMRNTVELQGALHSFAELHYSVDLLTEYQLGDRMSDFPLLVIPNSEGLTETFIEKVLKYVENGGSLFLMGNRCAKLFEKYLGVEFVGKPKQMNAQIKGSVGNVPYEGEWQEVNVMDARVLAYRYSGEGPQSRYSNMDIRDEGVSKEHSKYITKSPAITMRNIGKGKIAAAYLDLPLMYYNSHHPFLRQIISDVSKLLFEKPMVEIKAPSCVDMALRYSKDGELYIHLLNLANMPLGVTRSFCDYIPPIRSIEVKVNTMQKPSSVMWEPEGKKLDWKWGNGVLEINIPELKIHGAVVIKE